MTVPNAPIRPARRLGAVRAVAAGGWCVAVVAAGAGWLYLLRDAGALGVGPHLGGALPLQRLAGADGQPLARLVVAWLPAGLAAGWGLAALTGLRRSGRAAVAGAVAACVLALTGAVADTVTANERLGEHVAGQAGHPASWVAVALVVAGTLTAPSRTPRSRHPAAGPPDATRPAAAGRAAA